MANSGAIRIRSDLDLDVRVVEGGLTLQTGIFLYVTKRGDDLIKKDVDAIIPFG